MNVMKEGYKMKAYKKLFLVFVMAFGLALAGGSLLSVHADAQCAPCGLSLSFQSPCSLQQPAYSGPNYYRDGNFVSPAEYWHQFYNG